MSSIERLKAEARALRAAEKARGKIITHCDALEQVARSHGYANWRACLAMLSDPAAPSAATSGSSPTPITPSALAGGDFAVARENALTGWLARGMQQATVDFSRNIGLLPIYSEASPQGVRYLFWHLPAGATCEVRSGRTQEQFLAFHRTNHDKRRRLATLHTSSIGQHSAVWISEGHYTVAMEFLSRFGIGPAAVRHSSE